MPVDPRVDLAVRARLPGQDSKFAALQRLTASVADHDRRLAALERGTPALEVTNGLPSTTPREGVAGVDNAVPRIVVYVNGGWHYVNLT